MGISGNIKTMPLADLLQWLADGSKTGTLRLDNGSVEKRLHFLEGRVISTASSDPKEYLGHFLVSNGYINEIELAEALQMQDSNKMLLGKILTSIGVISEENLEEMLYQKSEETLYELFSWSAAEFQFLDDELPDGALHPIDLNVTRIILGGTQRLDEWELIRSHISSSNAVPVSVAELTSDDPKATAVLEAVDDDRTIDEIAMHTHSSEFHVCRILVDQILDQRLKIVRPRVSATPEVQPVPTTSSDALIQEAQRRLQELDYAGGLRYLRAAKSLNPDNQNVREAMAEAETLLREALRNYGIELDSVPRISADVDDITRLDMSPDEGFLMSRINGSLDIRTILKISPIDSLEAQVSFLRLKSAGYIELD